MHRPGHASQGARGLEWEMPPLLALFDSCAWEIVLENLDIGFLSPG